MNRIKICLLSQKDKTLLSKIKDNQQKAKKVLCWEIESKKLDNYFKQPNFINPKLTIIIPVLNNLAGLQESIKSIKNQTFKDFEVWIIDGGSSLETQNYLNLLEKPFFYQSRLDKGVYDAMNNGVELAKGKWLYFLGSGDVLHNKNI